MGRPLTDIETVLDDRVRRAVCHDLNHPATHLTHALGPVPSGRGRQQWIDAATLIETYRLEHDVTDQRSPLGPRPTNPLDALIWEDTTYTIERIVEPLERRALGRPLPSRPGPALGTLTASRH